MSVQGLTFQLRVDANQANVALAETRTAAQTLAGQEKALATATDQATVALDKQAGAARKLDFSMATLQKQAKGLAGTMQKQAAAISLVSTSLGEQGGKMGEVIKGAGQMAAAFGAGGPWAAALVGGIALVGQFNKFLERKLELQDRELAQQHALVDSGASRVIQLEREAREMELRARTSQEAAQQERDALTAQLETARAMRISHEVQKKFVGLTKEQIQQHGAMAGLYKREEAAIQRKIAALKKMEDQQRATMKSAAGAVTGDDGPVVFDPTAALAASAEKIRQAQEKREAQAAEGRRRVLENNAEMERQAAVRRFEIEERLQQDLDRLNAEHIATRRDQTMMAVGMVAGSLQGLVGDLIAQQDKAFERFAVSIMAQAGQVLVGEGIKLAGIAVTSGLTGQVPLAAAQGAGSAALIASGVALGGTAQGLGTLMGGSGMGRDPGRALPAAPAQMGDGGGTQVTIVYAGVSGPEADQGARAIVDGQRRAQRRNLWEQATR